MKSNGLIKKIVGAALSALVFLGFAFAFISQSVTSEVIDKTTTETFTWSGWLDYITNLENYENIGWWNTSHVLYIIFFVLISLVVVGLIVSMFVENKYLTMAVKWASVVTIVMAIVAFITLFVGCGLLSSDISDLVPGAVAKTTILPNFGSILMFLLGIAGPAVAISACSAKKAKKRK